MLEALAYSLIAGLLTGAGALPLIFIKEISHKWKDSLIGFASGVMVAVSFLALLAEALEIGGALQIIVGLTAGFLIIGLIERFVPHFEIGEIGFDTIKVKRRMILIASAIALHNVPEGFAVGVSFGSEVPGLGLLIVIAIAVHNAPEGLVVAAPLKELGYPNWKVFLITAATGINYAYRYGNRFCVGQLCDAFLFLGCLLLLELCFMLFLHDFYPKATAMDIKNRQLWAFLLE
jgi:ZIP family zinc transporter